MRRLLLATAWLGLSLAWLDTDRLLRDGDEEGHVGAAELFAGQLAAGDHLGFLQDAFAGDLGEYPPLFPALVGAWWHLLGGQPGAAPVRAVCLLGLLLAAWATGRLAAAAHGARDRTAGEDLPAAEAAGTLAFGLTLCLPLANGLTRHFMPEGLLVGAVAASVWLAWRAANRPGPGSALALGAAVGLGLLVKQTYLLLAIVPVLVAGARAGRWLFVSAGTAALVAGPWYIRHAGDQLAYGQQSVARASDAASGLLGTVGYYPATALWLGIGPWLALVGLAAVAIVALRARGEGRRTLVLAAAWGLGGLVLLTVVPKKYPRLMAPLTPAVALLAGVAMAHVPRRRLGLGVAMLPAAAWAAGASLVPIAEPAFVPEADPRCLQVWLRPPVPDDMGMAAVAAAARAAREGPVVVRGGPEIPCAVQTTHPWADHLAPYLRRAGMEREVVSDGRGAVRVDWTRDEARRGAQWVAVPSLDSGFSLDHRPAR
ncbi:MAG: glycosyltransferase family 39 protein [Myxococcota bacterium]|nr:glycosyltransferase family 39 protein [Myxococcota bacterium]MEC8423884.1 glycosyltransferase family 39 protein [Myxococcota bacterium]